MMATWFQGSVDEFIRVSREGWDKGVSILHFLGGCSIDLAGNRAIAQTKMTISQRGDVDGVRCDVVCTGRFYDFIEKRADKWGMVLRQPIYEKDRIDPIDPSATLKLDQQLCCVFRKATVISRTSKPDWLQGEARHAWTQRARGAGAVCPRPRLARRQAAHDLAALAAAGSEVMQTFTYEPLPQRVLFGAGRSNEIAAQVEALGCRRALVLSTKERRDAAERVAALLGGRVGGIFAGAVMHTPVAVTEAALAIYAENACDCVVAIGGGSTIGLGKAIALRTDAPQIVVPTTYAGSEVTPILGQTEDGKKTTQRTLKVAPEIVIYDVDLTLTLPARMTATSGMNAIAHAVEALYARDANPVICLMAEEGIRALAASLPVLIERPQDKAVRYEAQYGAWLCGTTLGVASMALHHKICHALGGAFDLPHADMHAIVLPHVASFNAAAAPEALNRVARAIGANDAGQGLFDLERRLGIPRGLREIGMPDDGVDRAVELIIASPYWNPRPVDAASLRPLLQRALNGDRPQAG